MFRSKQISLRGIKFLVTIACMLLFVVGCFTTMPLMANSTELAEDSWNTKTPMSNYPWGNPEIVVLDGKIYTIGGGDLQGNTTNSGYVECYEPKIDTWTTLTSMPTPRADVSIVVYQGKIYCIGGYVSNSGSIPMIRYTDIVEVYDPKTDSWSKKTSVPIETRTPIQACVVREQLFVIGLNGELCLYDPAADSWSHKASLVVEIPSKQLAPYKHGYAVNGQLFVLVQKGHRLEMYMYNSDADLWTKKDNPPIENDAYVTTVKGRTVVVDNKLIIPEWNGVYQNIAPSNQDTTGINSDKYSGLTMRTKVIGVTWKLWIYNSKTDSWSEGKTSPMFTNSGDQIFGVTSGVYAPVKVYVFGYTQLDLDTVQAVTWVYDPAKNVWSTANALQMDRQVSTQSFDKLVIADDIYYLMGKGGLNEQYTPIGYSPETGHLLYKSSSTGRDQSLNITAIVTIVLTISVVTVCLFGYFRKKRKTGKGKMF
ncbi:MAG: hypothetical protein FWD52_00175 [Candidatus Bathyarchaeota archaeon]|nr:hypothetical protein [Candidatus Termiticorpusculum sp.]